MQFSEWIKSKGLKQGWVAEQLDMSNAHLSNILRWLRDGTGGRRSISDENRARIMDLTGGEVTLEELTWPHGRTRYPSYEELQGGGNPT